MENLRILVVGAGNSGGDVAAELSNVAQKVYLSTRRGSWIFPRLLKKGKPFDVYFNRRFRLVLPSSYAENTLKKAANRIMDHKRFGLKPSHPIRMQHPTINDEIQAKILTGTVSIKKDIKEFTENGVIFNDEEEVTPIDVVVFATGFDIKFPFLSEDIVRVGKNNQVFLYKYMFPPQLKQNTLAIIGLVQPNGSLMPMFEIQSRLFAALMTGRCQLPSSEQMFESVKSSDAIRSRSYVPSSRHSIEAIWIQYMDDIAGMFGAKPSIGSMLLRDPKLFWACFFGPCLPYQYRLNGPHNWDGARNAILNYKQRLYEHMQNGRN